MYYHRVRRLFNILIITLFLRQCTLRFLLRNRHIIVKGNKVLAMDNVTDYKIFYKKILKEK